MKKHRRRRHKQERFVKFWWYISPDMLIYLFFLASEIWKSIKIAKNKESGIEKFIPFAFDAAILAAVTILIIVIYKRNQDENKEYSRSNTIIALFCVTLLITALKCIIYA